MALTQVSSDGIKDANVNTDDIVNNSVTTSKMADMPTGRILGRQASGTGDP